MSTAAPRMCATCHEPILGGQRYFIRPIQEHTMCRKAVDEGHEVGAALVRAERAEAEVARLRAARDEAIALKDYAIQCFATEEACAEEAQAEVERLRAFLVALRDHSADGNIRCSSCRRGEYHGPECELVALLGGAS